MRKTFNRAITILLAVTFVFAMFGGCTQTVEPESTTSTTRVESTTAKADQEDAAEVDYNPDEPVTVSDEVSELAQDTKEEIKDGKDLSTDETFKYEGDAEKGITDMGAILPDSKNEVDGVVEQENISYDGVNTGKGVKLLGNWQGLTFYAQNDRKWANVLYTSTGNKSQTIKSSGCGPTSAAMVVSSSKGAILPTTMSKLYVDNGFRTANNGTAWVAMAFTADYFGFSKFTTTSSYSKLFQYLSTDKNKDGVSDYFAVVSCGYGLWTTGGHYIAILSDDNGTLGVRDPYPYWGKYDTASRKGAKVVVSGNIAYVTESKFKAYSNMQQAFIFSNDHKATAKPSTNKDKGKSKSNKTSKVNYTRYVATQSDNLNVRKGPGKNYALVGRLKKGTKVTVTEVNGSWSKVGTNRWVSSAYLSATPVNSSSSTASVSYKTKVNSTYKFKSNTKVYSKSNLSGTVYQYKAGTSAKVISHVSATVDYVYIAATGRKAYVNVSAFNLSSNSRSKTKSTVNQTKYLKSKTTLYSKSNLSGTQYLYLAGTPVKILKNVSSSVDYIQVIKTGRKAYVKTSAYK